MDMSEFASLFFLAVRYLLIFFCCLNVIEPYKTHTHLYVLYMGILKKQL